MAVVLNAHVAHSGTEVVLAARRRQGVRASDERGVLSQRVGALDDPGFAWVATQEV